MLPRFPWEQSFAEMEKDGQPLKTKFNKTPTGMIKPNKKGAKQIKKQAIAIKPFA